METFWSSHPNVFLPGKKSFELNPAFIDQFFSTFVKDLPIGHEYQKRKDIIHNCIPLRKNDIAELDLSSRITTLGTTIGFAIDASVVRRLIQAVKLKYEDWAQEDADSVYLARLINKRKNTKRTRKRQRDKEIPILPAHLSDLVYNFKGDARHSSRWPVLATEFFLLRMLLFC
jgi:hypothetical protein